MSKTQPKVTNFFIEIYVKPKFCKHSAKQIFQTLSPRRTLKLSRLQGHGQKREGWRTGIPSHRGWSNRLLMFGCSRSFMSAWNNVTCLILFNICRTRSRHGLFEGSFEKLRKASISLDMRVCPSVHMGEVGSHWTDFHEIRHLYIFRKSVKKNPSCLLLRMRNVSDKTCRENQNTNFMFHFFFRK